MSAAPLLQCAHGAHGGNGGHGVLQPLGGTTLRHAEFAWRSQFLQEVAVLRGPRLFSVCSVVKEFSALPDGWGRRRASEERSWRLHRSRWQFDDLEPVAAEDVHGG